MTLLRPFPGLVVDPDWADRVTTGPYDAYSPIQRAAIAAANAAIALAQAEDAEAAAEQIRTRATLYLTYHPYRMSR